MQLAFFDAYLLGVSRKGIYKARSKRMAVLRLTRRYLRQFVYSVFAYSYSLLKFLLLLPILELAIIRP